MWFDAGTMSAYHPHPLPEDPDARIADELRLAKKVQPALVARNR
jgi:hypothetical protein